MAGNEKPRNTNFTALGYDSLRLRYVAHTDDQKRARELQVKIVKARLLAYSPGGELIFNHWRGSDLKQICMSGGRCSPVESPVNFKEENIFLMCSEIDIRAVHELMGFVSQLQSESGTKGIFVEGTIVPPARSDSYFATVVTCFSDDGTDKASGHPQILYQGTVASVLLRAYNLFIGWIRIFDEVWCAEELRLCSPFI